METLQHLLERGRATLTVYSPDAFRSRLVGHLEEFISRRTGLRPGGRFWVTHDPASIEAFYLNSIANNAGRWNLVVELFTAGPSLLTVWIGDEAGASLQALKGRSHPADADPGTIRSLFWCDNPVCNLIHISDDAAEAQRELTSLGLQRILERPQTAQGRLLSLTDEPRNHVAHSGIVTFCSAINRIRETQRDLPPLPFVLPESGDARETEKLLTSALKELSGSSSDDIVCRLRDDYLGGRGDALLSRLRGVLPLTRWEEFVIRSGVLTRGKWTERQ